MLDYMNVLEINSTAINQLRRKKANVLIISTYFFTSLYDRCYLQSMNMENIQFEQTRKSLKIHEIFKKNIYLKINIIYMYQSICRIDHRY